MIRLSLLLALLLLSQRVVPQVQVDPAKIVVSSTGDFFSKYTELKDPPPRGEFETMDEYRKRLPRYDTTSVVYLLLAVNDIVSGKNYSYDIDKQLLTFYGGKSWKGRPSTYKPRTGKAILVNTDSKETAYKASNAFGAKVSVKKLHASDYVLNLLNLHSLPDSIRTLNGTFKISLQLPPKEAQKLSQSTSIVIGIRPVSPLRSALEVTMTKEPTFDSPTELAAFLYWIDANITGIYLYEKRERRVLWHMSP